MPYRASIMDVAAGKNGGGKADIRVIQFCNRLKTHYYQIAKYIATAPAESGVQSVRLQQWMLLRQTDVWIS